VNPNTCVRVTFSSSPNQGGAFTLTELVRLSRLTWTPHVWS